MVNFIFYIFYHNRKEIYMYLEKNLDLVSKRDDF